MLNIFCTGAGNHFLIHKELAPLKLRLLTLLALFWRIFRLQVVVNSLISQHLLLSCLFFKKFCSSPLFHVCYPIQILRKICLVNILKSAKFWYWLEIISWCSCKGSSDQIANKSSPDSNPSKCNIVNVSFLLL